MNNKEILNEVVSVHNLVVEIAVKGDDTLRMAQAIQTLRQLAQQLQQNDNTEDKSSTLG